MAKTIIDIEVKANNSEEIIGYMQEQLETALMTIGAEAEGYAKDDCPVDTGRLRNSINWATNTGSGDGDDAPQGTPDKNTVYIGTNVEYGVYVEYGDMKHEVGKKHFLRDAMANNGDYFKDLIRAALDT